MGTPDLAATCLDALIRDGRNVVLAVCQPDKPVGRKKIITPPPVKVRAEEAGIEVFQPASMKTDEAFEKIDGIKPDIIITAAYGKILPKPVLDIPKYGCINVHGSLLPRYRGASPVQQAILNGDDMTGVTIMKMDVGMDTGDMLSRVEVPIDPDIHMPELMHLLAVKGSELLLSTLDDYVGGKIIPVPQDENEATSCTLIESSDGEFDFSSDALTIHNKVRALSQWPGAFVISNGRKIKVYDTSYLPSFDETDTDPYEPGVVVKARKSDLIVKCGSGFIKINELQSEGGKRLRACDCAHNFKVGEKF
ncbi:MAG: methionyl-tRNA formyltransferase [Clostridiales bacterium]|nr:methionyl-tRNA formyltransferase [Clostridiales bacterium]